MSWYCFSPGCRLSAIFVLNWSKRERRPKLWICCGLITTHMFMISRYIFFYSCFWFNFGCSKTWTDHHLLLPTEPFFLNCLMINLYSGLSLQCTINSSIHWPNTPFCCTYNCHGSSHWVLVKNCHSWAPVCYFDIVWCLLGRLRHNLTMRSLYKRL